MKVFGLFMHVFWIFSGGYKEEGSSSSSTGIASSSSIPSKPFTVLVEGNVGSGKSTMLEFIRDEMGMAAEVNIGSLSLKGRTPERLKWNSYRNDTKATKMQQKKLQK